MIIEISFSNGRCFFNEFSPNNEIPFNNGKTGVNYCRYRFIGVLLEKLGLAFRMDYHVNGELRSCHIYKNSFQKWVDRHKNDLGLADNKAISKQSQKTPDTIIKMICENFFVKDPSLSACSISSQPLSYLEIIQKAELIFEKHDKKKEILEEIIATLNHYDYKNSIDNDKSPQFRFEDKWYEFVGEWQLLREIPLAQDSNERELSAINFIKELINNLKLDIDLSPGLYKKVIELAKDKFQDDENKQEIMSHVEEKMIKKQVMHFLNNLPGVDNSEREIVEK